jgi:hypothetical protein
VGPRADTNSLTGLLRRPLLHVAVFSFLVNLLLGATVALGIVSNRVVYSPSKHSEG